VAFDPFLYVAFALGFLVGRLVRRRSRWVSRATGLLGASLNDVAIPSLAVTVPIAFGFALLVLGLTAIVSLMLARLRPAAEEHPPLAEGKERFPLSVGLVGAVLVGFGIGRLVPVPTDPGITWTLYVLLALVAFDLPLKWHERSAPSIACRPQKTKS
jgi:ABC-type Fe3+ transport system permease subunit